jgi:hypothetical protein
VNKKGAKEAGWKKQKKVGGADKLMRGRAKRIRENQAWVRKKEGKPAYFGAYVKTRYMTVYLIESLRSLCIHCVYMVLANLYCLLNVHMYRFRYM